MIRDMLVTVLVKVLLALAIFMVELFNDMDTGPVDYQVVAKPFDDDPPF